MNDIDPMNEQENKTEQATLETVKPLLVSNEQIMSYIKTYKNTGQASLLDLDKAISKTSEQLTKLQKMRLVIASQLELLVDLENKSTVQPEVIEPKN